MRFLIFGASFKNRGAQSMIFTSVNEIRNRFPDAQITVMATVGCESDIKKMLNFDYVVYNQYYDCLPDIKWFRKGILYLKSWVNTFIRKKYISKKKYIKNWEQANIIFDISGFLLSSQWPEFDCRRYLSRIDTARRYGKKIYLLPQSFGPFDFAQSRILDIIKAKLSYAEIVFAREKSGLHYLESLQLNNVQVAYDLVLTSKHINMENVFKEMLYTKDLIGEKTGIAIIPNFHTKGNTYEELILKYKDLIDAFLHKKENIFIVKHSSADGQICQDVYQHYLKNSNVYLFIDDYSSLEFEQMTSHFKFAIASRYHSIVHCYKNKVPCVLVGWATKYSELAELFDQEKYVIDVRNTTNLDRLVSVSLYMNNNYLLEKGCIEDQLKVIQKSSCFDTVFKEGEIFV